jgi:hypothetical protein
MRSSRLEFSRNLLYLNNLICSAMPEKTHLQKRELVPVKLGVRVICPNHLWVIRPASALFQNPIQSANGKDQVHDSVRIQVRPSTVLPGVKPNMQTRPLEFTRVSIARNMLSSAFTKSVPIFYDQARPHNDLPR